MKQKIAGFHLDAESHWVADLECGHGQHVRHDPPWMVRDWVVTEEGRASRLGHELNCVRCDEMGLKVARRILAECKTALRDGYETAGMSGLCEEGRFENAVGSLDSIQLEALVESALKSV